MSAVQRIRGAQRKSDAVQAQRIAQRESVEQLKLGAAVAEIVLGVHLEPTDRGLVIKHLLLVRFAQADPGIRRNRSRGTGRRAIHRRQARLVRQLLLVRLPPLSRSQVPAGSLIHSLPSPLVVARPWQP